MLLAARDVELELEDELVVLGFKALISFTLSMSASVSTIGFKF